MPATPNSNSDLQHRLVLARVGWCRRYNETPGDEPLRGGEHNLDRIGSEFANFTVVEGRIYGYVRLGKRGQMNALRVAGSHEDNLKDVAVALFATTPGGAGQALVGWCRHATMTSDVYPRRPGGAYGVYVWSARAKDAVLLPIAARHVPIPRKGKGATGQQNVNYARDEQGALRRDAWIGRVRRFLESYRGPSLVGLDQVRSSEVIASDEAEALLRGQDILQNARMRVAIEHRAMLKVSATLRAERCTDIQDVHEWESFDFLCRKGSLRRKIEVKGTRTAGKVLLFSAAEVDLAERERVDLYVVYGIKLSGSAKKGWKASGGTVRFVEDWGRERAARKAMGWRVTV